jgi:hypothetical protein
MPPSLTPQDIVWSAGHSSMHAALLCIKLLCSCAQPTPQGPGNAEESVESSDASCTTVADTQCARNCKAVATSANVAAWTRCLCHPDASVREAAAQIFRVLGRSVDAIAQDCFGDPELAVALMRALDDEEVRVRTAACFAICNLASVSTCPTRQMLLDKVRDIEARGLMSQ